MNLKIPDTMPKGTELKIAPEYSGFQTEEGEI